MRRLAALLLLPAVALACNQRPLEERIKVDAGDVPGGLTQEEAKKVLAKVGDRTITLGDFAAALERMNEFDRMRYQAPDKRKELLDEMIDLELLGIEAKRRGLDKEPDTQEQVRQILRDAMLADSRRGIPLPAEIPQAEVRGYYDAHRDEFKEPERRRIQVIAFKDKKEAEKTLPDAKKATPMEFGKLVLKYADDPVLKPTPSHPLETMGDLGIVGPPGDAKGDNPRVGPALRKAVFEIQGDVGTVLDRVVQDGSKFYIVRLAGKTPPHDRAFAEAERSIRGILVQQKIEERTKSTEDELKKKFPVSIDEAALARVAVPGMKNDGAPAGSSSSAPSAPAPSK